MQIENALQTLQPLPEDMATWSNIVRGLPSNAALRLDDMNIDVANLQTLATRTPRQAEPGQTNSAAEVQRTLNYAIEIDKRLAAWPDSLPPSWYVRRISLPAWLSCQPPTDYAPKLFSTTTEVAQRMTDGICANIPFHLGDKMKPVRLGNQTVNFPQLPGMLPKDHYRVAAAVGSWFIIGALYSAMNPQLPLKEGQRAWIGGQLRRAMIIYNIQR